jgi:phosphosulfolactate synthase
MPIICSERLRKWVCGLEQPFWSKMIPNPLSGRVDKPRISGLTMVIDTGQPITVMRDLFELAASHIDFWKFGFGSAAVCPPERILDKITLCQEYEILAYPGGTTLEIMFASGDWKQYMHALWRSGVRVIEVSDGTITLPVSKRREMIREAKKIGFIVLTEVGKKIASHSPGIDEQAQTILGDIASGASYVIVEGRESGIGVGMYDESGEVKDWEVDELANLVGPYRTRLIWEAPLVKQQAYYLNKFGNHINFGNVRPGDIVALESLRRGLRSDTLRLALGYTNDRQEAAMEADSSGNAGKSGPAGKQAGLPTLWTDGYKHRNRKS